MIYTVKVPVLKTLEPYLTKDYIEISTEVSAEEFIQIQKAMFSGLNLTQVESPSTAIFDVFNPIKVFNNYNK
jgi:hypothetical protein